ncbi:hypothetical protein Ae201684_001217 [Aphanomyces euteiches]|uniref:Uncharacterized protein n=1 Tax=Aphanomyces euteiches TaxID=100861 RepID=A0A6G0XW90_9STRA|nr:hypothetical protein Ae201684_001217 [Aphanomyces euteiches]KAH9136578.1 hypothetical protein AeRB84_018351 [Aphanomyces euteiches]
MTSAPLQDDSWISKSNWTRTDDSDDQNGKISLRYLDEFIGDLKCSAKMLEWGLFPDAKEVSETMGVFNALRHVLIHMQDKASTNTFRNGIVVVGDGVTPRTAAMFAYRTKDWMCYSVDPLMKDDEEMPWNTMGNVVAIRDKIENVRIRLNKAIVVLVHAHVTIEQALHAIQADDIVAVLTLPCCNWYGRQELCFDRHPDFVYDDMSILSTHREIRLWFGSSVHDAQKKLQLVGSCKPKIYVTPVASASSADRFLDLILQQKVELADTTITDTANYMQQRFDSQSRVLVVGDHPPFVSALASRGFTAIRSLTARPKVVDLLPVDIVVDPCMLHAALNRTEKTKAGKLVGELCQLWKSWLNPNTPSAAVLIVSSRRVLRNAKFLNRPALVWTVSSTTLRNPDNFIYECVLRLTEKEENNAACPGLEEIQENLNNCYVPLTEKGAIAAEGAITRIQTLHAHLSFVDILSDDNVTSLILLRSSSLAQISQSMLKTILMNIQIGDSIQVTGFHETTKNGSVVVVATALRVVQLKSRETLLYFS